MTTSTKSDSAAKRDVTKLQRAIVDGLENVKAQDIQVRSEEHTSELQSPCNLVCRLLLEKKTTRIPRTRLCDETRRRPTGRIASFRRARDRSGCPAEDAAACRLLLPSLAPPVIVCRTPLA